MNEIEFLQKMLCFFKEIDSLKKNLEDEISRVDKERNDLLHELELGKLNAVQITRVAIVLKDVLKERRKYKDELEKINCIKRFTDKYNNKFITGDILNLIKTLNELETNKENKKYKPRVIKDLKCVEE